MLYVVCRMLYVLLCTKLLIKFCVVILKQTGQRLLDDSQEL